MKGFALLLALGLVGCGSGGGESSTGGGSQGSGSPAISACLDAHPDLRKEEMSLGELAQAFQTATRDCGASRSQVLEKAKAMEQGGLRLRPAPAGEM